MIDVFIQQYYLQLMATVPQISAMKTAAGKGLREIGNFMDSLLTKIWGEGALSQFCRTAAQLNSNNQLEAKLKQRIFRFVTRERKYHYLGYLKYKWVNREEKDIMLPNKYFLELRKEEISEQTHSKSFFSRVISSIMPKKRKLKEQRLSVCLFEKDEVLQMFGTAYLDEEIQIKIIDWYELTIQKQAEDLLKLWIIQTQQLSMIQKTEETSKFLNAHQNFDHLQ